MISPVSLNSFEESNMRTILSKKIPQISQRLLRIFFSGSAEKYQYMSASMACTLGRVDDSLRSDITGSSTSFRTQEHCRKSSCLRL
jgi:hypothetical protein